MDNLLKTILLKLFKEHNFKIIDLEAFMFNSDKIKLILALDEELNEYYLGISINNEQLKLLNSELQIELIQYIKKYSNEDPDKNTTLIILANDDSENTKRTAIAIEEDPYFFKKHVLKLNEQEKSILNNRISDVDSEMLALLKETILKTEVFERFYLGNNDEETIFYGIVTKFYEKFPFLQLPDSKSKELNLLKNIDNQLKRDELFNLKEEILEFKDEEQINRWIDSHLELEND